MNYIDEDIFISNIELYNWDVDLLKSYEKFNEVLPISYNTLVDWENPEEVSPLKRIFEITKKKYDNSDLRIEGEFNMFSYRLQRIVADEVIEGFPLNLKIYFKELGNASNL